MAGASVMLTAMKMFDAHCHLQDPRLDASLGDVMQRAKAAGVSRMVCCGTTASDWRKVALLCARHSELVPAFGVHPWRVNGMSPSWFDTLTDMIASEPSATVGEIGLDYSILERDETLQEEVFCRQLQLAVALRRPAAIHCRKAWGSMMRILAGFGGLPEGFMVHSYSGSAELVAPLVKLGAYLSFSGSITRHRNTHGHAAAAAVPIDRLLIETDSPDLAPVKDGSPRTGEELNEPANLIFILRTVARLRGVQENELAERTWNNAQRLFLAGNG